VHAKKPSKRAAASARMKMEMAVSAPVRVAVRVKRLGPEASPGYRRRAAVRKPAPSPTATSEGLGRIRRHQAVRTASQQRTVQRPKR